MNTRNRILLTLMIAGGASIPALGAFAADSVIQNRSIGYVMTSEFKGIYDTKDRKECPEGLNDGPREQFKAQFPEKPGVKYNLLDTELAREGDIWWPKTTPDQFPYKYAVGNIAYGVNLDGKVGPNDFTSPDGEKGIDNELQRAWGCVEDYRSTSYNLGAFNNWRKYPYNIVVIEISNIDNLLNDDNVTVTTYRGLDKVMTDASGASYLPGATQRPDLRWGKRFIQKFHGKIVNGVLRTDGADYLMPSAGNGSSIADIHYYNTQWQLTLTPEEAQGVMGGYMDIDDWQIATNTQRSTHHQAYGAASTASIYRAMLKMADYRPDPKTGQNTAISSALRVRLTQVFIKHPDTVVSQAGPTSVAGKSTAGGQ